MWEPKVRRKGEIELPAEVAAAVTKSLSDGLERIVRPAKELPLIWIVEPKNPWISTAAIHTKYQDVTITAVMWMRRMGVLR